MMVLGDVATIVTLNALCNARLREASAAITPLGGKTWPCPYIEARGGREGGREGRPQRFGGWEAFRRL